jgi:hypothetical protein
VTSQACGIKGFGNTTVKLTKQQYQNLEQYLVDFRARLNKTTTREEALPLFKEAVVELNKYGLLPKGMSVKNAQKIVTLEYIPYRVRQFMTELMKKSPCFYDKNLSILCLIYGQAGYPEMKITRLLFPISQYFYEKLFLILWNYWYNSPNINPIIALLLIPIVLIVYLFVYFSGITEYYFMRNPVHILSTIKIADTGGIVQSQGINGVRLWQGRLTGVALGSPLSEIFGYPGVIGFTGIGFSAPDITFFMGAALMAKIHVE